MGSGNTRDLKERSTVSVSTNNSINSDASSVNRVNMEEEEEDEVVIKRKCKYFKVSHSSYGRKFLQIQQWLGDVDSFMKSDEFSNPLLPLKELQIEIVRD